MPSKIKRITSGGRSSLGNARTQINNYERRLNGVKNLHLINRSVKTMLKTVRGGAR